MSELQPRKRHNILSHLGSTIKTVSHYPLRLRSRQNSKLKVHNEEVASESELCSMCNTVFVRMDYNEASYRSPQTFPFTFAMLEKSAQDGCFLCRRMLKKFRWRFDERLRDAPNSEAVGFRFIKQPFAGRLHVSAQFYFPYLEDKLRGGVEHAVALVPAERRKLLKVIPVDFFLPVGE